MYNISVYNFMNIVITVIITVIIIIRISLSEKHQKPLSLISCDIKAEGKSHRISGISICLNFFAKKEI